MSRKKDTTKSAGFFSLNTSNPTTMAARNANRADSDAQRARRVATIQVSAFVRPMPLCNKNRRD